MASYLPPVLFLCLAFFYLVSCGEQYLRFVHVLQPDEVKSSFNIPMGHKPTQVDASVSQQTRIKILDYLNELPIFMLHCRIAKLDRNAELTSSHLCKKHTVSSPEDCFSTNSGNLVFGKIIFTASGNKSNGYTFTSKLPVGKVVLDGFYFCKYRNRNGKLESNLVEVQDIYYYQNQMVNRPIKEETYLPVLSAAKLPLQLECGRSQVDRLPDWADSTFPSPFQWAMCNIDEISDTYQCLKQARDKPINVGTYLDHTVLSNGTLVLFRRTPAAWQPAVLICYSFLKSSKAFSIYYGGNSTNQQRIRYDDSAGYPASGHIEALSPIKEDQTVRAGSLNFQLNAVYRANQDSITYTWSKDNDRIPPDFKGITPFTLGFPTPLTQNHSGLYTLKIADPATGSTLTIAYTVRVVGQPVVKRRPPSHLVVVEGHELTFDCELSGHRTTSLEINGVEVLPSSNSKPEELLQQFPYLKEVKLHPLKFSGSVIQYRVGNLFFSPGFPQGPSHLVAITGSNSYGIIRLSTQITVLRRPKLLLPPKNCTVDKCWSSSSHQFDCRFDLDQYNSLRDIVEVRHTWELDGTDLSSLQENHADQAAYLEVNGPQLILRPVDSGHVSLFQETQITCRLRIYARKSSGVSTKPVVSHSSSGGGYAADSNEALEPIYDSKDDLTLKSLLTASVYLKLVDEPTKASISWIAAVLIAAVILVIVAALIAFVVMRNRGQTYMLDREERALGNDPVKEYREKEGFRTYERADEPPLCGSRYSGNDGSPEIGSDADGELDGYSIDPGKFNEDGSFIDQYATDTPYKGHSRLPLLPKNYDSQA